jgi:hypothetical protein
VEGVRLPVDGSFRTGARSPSGKAKVCKTFIGGSIPPRASNFFLRFFPLGVFGDLKNSKFNDWQMHAGRSACASKTVCIGLFLALCFRSQ